MTPPAATGRRTVASRAPTWPKAEEGRIPTYDAEIRVTPREGVLDPEGETIASALEHLGYEGVGGVRAGRLIRLRLQAADEEAAREALTEMCEELIANPVIEDFAIRLAADTEDDAG